MYKFSVNILYICNVLITKITAYATQNQINSSPCVFYLDHLVVSRFHGNITRVVRMAGEDTVPAGRAGLECRGHSFMGGIDARVWTGVLFGDLSVRSVSGCGILV